MLQLKTLIAGVALTFCTGVNAQETISIMYYNLLKFPDINSARITYLEEIVQHVQPDIFVVCELTSGTGANTILNSAMNTGPITYAGASYVNGPDTENMLYYNTAKLGLVDENIISTSLRDINEYILYYKDPLLTAQSDTAYLYVYGLHLKAGNNSSDASERASQTSTLRSYLNTRSNPENTIVGGDFNIYYSSEAAYTNMTGQTNANLHDVIGAGSYHNNNMFAIHFTQSTRTTAFDGGSTGGMDDRFDMMLFSDDMLNGDNGVKYSNGTYTAIGQDGLRWNQSLVSPTNNSEPANIINALYYMSDHLPIYMELEVGGGLGLQTDFEKDFNIYPNPAEDQLNVSYDGVSSFTLILSDMQGRELFQKDCQLMDNQVDMSDLNPGNYLLSIQNQKGSFTKKIIKK
jgi:exonuclease III